MYHFDIHAHRVHIKPGQANIMSEPRCRIQDARYFTFDPAGRCGYRQHARETDYTMLVGDFLSNSTELAPDRVALIGRGPRPGEGQAFWRAMGFGDLMDILQRRL